MIDCNNNVICNFINFLIMISSWAQFGARHTKYRSKQRFGQIVQFLAIFHFVLRSTLLDVTTISDLKRYASPDLLDALALHFGVQWWCLWKSCQVPITILQRNCTLSMRFDGKQMWHTMLLWSGMVFHFIRKLSTVCLYSSISILYFTGLSRGLSWKLDMHFGSWRWFRSGPNHWFQLHLRTHLIRSRLEFVFMHQQNSHFLSWSLLRRAFKIRFQVDTRFNITSRNLFQIQ